MYAFGFVASAIYGIFRKDFYFSIIFVMKICIVDEQKMLRNTKQTPNFRN